MNLKKIIYSAAAAANAVSIAAFVILTAAGSSLAKSQSYNMAALRWDSDGGYAQVSCFLSDDSGFTTDDVGGVKAELLSKLQNIAIVPEEGKELIPQAYSVPAGQMTVRCDSSGRAEAQVTAVGGDFFLFRDFKLLNGAYFSDKDMMQDGAVIDRRLAWALYGSVNVAGMNIYINGTKFFISGVVEDPQTKQEKKTAGDSPRAYISYDGAALISGGGQSLTGDMSDGFPTDTRLKKISCYECLVPDPVENFGINAVKEYFKSRCEDSSSVVNNSKRFSPSVRAKAFKKLSDYAAVKKPIVYPYWENASRIVEFKLTSIYFYRRLTYIIPVLTALWLIVILWRGGGRLRHKITSGICDGFIKITYEHKQKKIRRKENISGKDLNL